MQWLKRLLSYFIFVPMSWHAKQQQQLASQWQAHFDQVIGQLQLQHQQQTYQLASTVDQVLERGSRTSFFSTSQASVFSVSTTFDTRLFSQAGNEAERILLAKQIGDRIAQDLLSGQYQLKAQIPFPYLGQR